MARPDQIPTDLAIDLGDDLSPDEFLAAVKHFLGYVEEITEAQSGDGSDINWTVRVREGSYLIGVEPQPTAAPSRLAMIYKMAAYAPPVISGGEVAASGLPEKAIGHLKSLSDLAAKNERGAGIRLWVEKSPITIGAGIAKAVREDWDSDYHDVGTIEGRLEAIRDSSGSVRIGVKDFLYPKLISCSVPEHLLEKALGSFRKRVEVEGLIHYRKDGSPISIEAQNIDVLPEDNDLPSADDVRGIMALA